MMEWWAYVLTVLSWIPVFWIGLVHGESRGWEQRAKYCQCFRPTVEAPHD
jgi:hypothetical protein